LQRASRNSDRLKWQRSERLAPGAAKRGPEVCGVGVLLSVQRDDHVNEVGAASIGVLPQMTLWLWFTIALGALCGGITAAVKGERRPVTA